MVAMAKKSLMQWNRQGNEIICVGYVKIRLYFKRQHLGPWALSFFGKEKREENLSASSAVSQDSHHLLRHTRVQNDLSFLNNLDFDIFKKPA